jgi:hydrogenase maturation factor
MTSAIYVRTTEGQAAAYDQVSAMPRKLRSLLKVIDGKTNDEVFTASLKGFGDVRGLLKSLAHAGLIRELSASERSLLPGQASQEKAQEKLQVQSPQRAEQERSNGFEATTQMRSTQPQYADTIMVSGGVERRAGSQQALQSLQQMMSDFVLVHVPGHAFVILKELEDTMSMEQLAVMLGGYEYMVREAGPAAQTHLMQVRQVLKDWM